MAGISKAERGARAAAAASEQGGAADGQDASSADGAAAAAAAPAGPSLVHMTRDATAFSAPHTAEVHPAEVGNYAAGGWQVAAD